MRTTTTHRALALGLLTAAPAAWLAGCGVDSDVTVEDARAAVREFDASSRSDLTTAPLVEVSTDVTIGEAIEDALDDIASFWESQAPCTAVSLDATGITVDFGSLDDNCLFNGHTFAGLDHISFDNLLVGDLQVHHAVDQLTNGDVTLDGDADVTWQGDGEGRNVAIDYTIADFVDANLVEVTGEHTIARLDPALPVWDGGFTLDGTRSWTRGRATWSVDMDGLELLPTDAAPQAGDVVVTDPKGRELAITYGRLDGDTVTATVTLPSGKVVVFFVTPDGEVVDGDEDAGA